MDTHEPCSTEGEESHAHTGDRINRADRFHAGVFLSTGGHYVTRLCGLHHALGTRKCTGSRRLGASPHRDSKALTPSCIWPGKTLLQDAGRREKGQHS